MYSPVGVIETPGIPLSSPADGEAVGLPAPLSDGKEPPNIDAKFGIGWLNMAQFV
jgi:hypothetical protein